MPLQMPTVSLPSLLQQQQQLLQQAQNPQQAPHMVYGNRFVDISGSTLYLCVSAVWAASIFIRIFSLFVTNFLVIRPFV